VDKRISARNRVLKVGTIEFDGSSINCMVRNLSNTGAALDLSDPDSVPEYFTLVMLAEGLRLPGQIVWRKGKRIGVTLDWTSPGPFSAL